MFLSSTTYRRGSRIDWIHSSVQFNHTPQLRLSSRLFIYSGRVAILWFILIQKVLKHCYLWRHCRWSRRSTFIVREIGSRSSMPSVLVIRREWSSSNSKTPWSCSFFGTWPPSWKILDDNTTRRMSAKWLRLDIGQRLVFMWLFKMSWQIKCRMLQAVRSNRLAANLHDFFVILIVYWIF